MLRLNKTQDIEVVPDVHVVYTCKLSGLSTPLRINIRYLEQKMKKDKLIVTISYTPFQEKENEETTKKKLEWQKTYQNPQFIMVHSMGDPKEDIRRLLSKKKPKRKPKQLQGQPTQFNIPDDSDSDDSEKKEAVVNN